MVQKWNIIVHNLSNMRHVKAEWLRVESLQNYSSNMIKTIFNLNCLINEYDSMGWSKDLWKNPLYFSLNLWWTCCLRKDHLIWDIHWFAYLRVRPLNFNMLMMSTGIVGYSFPINTKTFAWIVIKLVTWLSLVLMKKCGSNVIVYWKFEVMKESFNLNKTLMASTNETFSSMDSEPNVL